MSLMESRHTYNVCLSLKLIKVSLDRNKDEIMEFCQKNIHCKEYDFIIIIIIII